jgi:uncharacterized protein with FMN-binding domain
MRKIVVALGSTITGLVLLFSYRTSTNQGAPAGGLAGGAAVLPPVSAPSESTGSASAPPSTGGAPSSSSAPGTSTASSGSGTRTVNGGVAQTVYGPMQVQITVTNGKIASVNVLQEPDGSSHDLRINDYAVPILNQETVSAQSAQIDSVSGATYTSEGYISSLQSAIDAAHLS